MEKIVRKKELCGLVGLSYSTIYRLERAGRFPRRRRLGDNSVGWLLSEVAEWMAARTAVSYPSAASLSADEL